MITAFAVSIPLLLVIIAVSIGLAAWPALSRSGFSFLTGSKWTFIFCLAIMVFLAIFRTN